jgi:hypothetical protein
MERRKKQIKNFSLPFKSKEIKGIFIIDIDNNLFFNFNKVNLKKIKEQNVDIHEKENEGILNDNKNNLLENKKRISNQFQNRLKEIKNSKLIKEIKEEGLLFNFVLNNNTGISSYQIILWLLETGVISSVTNKNNIFR